MTTFVVTTSADVANGDVSENDLSLREAIELANASSGADRITFADGIDYIALTDKLPTISDGLRLVGGGDVVLDANADGDFDPATTAEDGNRRGLDIRGDDIAVTIDGLTITGGSASAGGAGIRSGRRVDLAVVDSRIAGNDARHVAALAAEGRDQGAGRPDPCAVRVEDNTADARRRDRGVRRGSHPAQHDQATSGGPAMSGRLAAASARLAGSPCATLASSDN